jgi:hypothetical protein
MVMCIGMNKEAAASNSTSTLRRECGQLCAKCRARNADLYGAQIQYVAAPSIHPDVIGPEEERFFREQAALRQQIELAEGDLWLFD